MFLIEVEVETFSVHHLQLKVDMLYHL